MKLEDILSWLATGTEQVRAGEAGSIETLGHFRTIAAALKKATEEVDVFALADAEKQPKQFSMGGYNWTKKDGNMAFDYKKVPAMVKLALEWDSEKDKADHAARMLMAMKATVNKDGYAVDKETGEIIGYPGELKPTKPGLTLVK